jgi:hypothetical protein
MSLYSANPRFWNLAIRGYSLSHRVREARRLAGYALQGHIEAQHKGLVQAACPACKELAAKVQPK